LIEDARGSGGSALTNSYQYATSGSSSGLLQQVTRATGGWEMYQYVSRSRLTNVLSAFLNQAPTNNSSLCRMVEHSYTTNDPVDFGRLRFNFPRRTVESLLGHEIARSYTVVSASELREIQCATAGATYTNADNLVTITKWYTNGANLDRRCSIEKPDGTMQLFQYGFYTNGSGDIFRTNIVLTGAPDSYKTNIIDGSKSIIVLGAVGQLLSRTTIDIASAITTGLETFSDYDSFNRPRKVTFLDNTYTWTDYGCCGPVNQTNREGTAIAYYKDGLQRHASTVTGGLTRTNVFDAAGNVLKRIRGGSDGTQITQLTNGYDTAGRLLTSRDALGNITTYTESLSSFQLSRTTTEHGRGS